MSSLCSWFRSWLGPIFLILGTLGLVAGPVPDNRPTHYPPWWFERDVIPRLDAANLSPDYSVPGTYAVPEDFVAANIGQLKYLATQAAAELDVTLPDPGAGPIIAALVASWKQSPASGVTRDDFAVVTQGQVKDVAKLFYDRLATINYQGAPLDSGSIYPWSATTSDDDSYSLVNVGQLKRVFSFDQVNETFWPDSDFDGLHDKWELFYFGDLSRDGTGDWNGDDLLDLDAFRYGLNPKGDDESLMPSARENFDYDERGWLVEYNWVSNPTILLTHDVEGNLEGLSQ